jgi:hypothetical protein
VIATSQTTVRLNFFVRIKKKSNLDKPLHGDMGIIESFECLHGEAPDDWRFSMARGGYGNCMIMRHRYTSPDSMMLHAVKQAVKVICLTEWGIYRDLCDGARGDLHEIW